MTEPASPSELEDLPPIGTLVRSACGGLIPYEADTPWVIFRGKRVFFCLPSCKRGYEKDPRTSCLAYQMEDGDPS